MNNIKQARLQMGYTQTETAQRANVPIRSYTRYESGQRVPDAMTAKRIAKVLETTVEKLF